MPVPPMYIQDVNVICLQLLERSFDAEMQGFGIIAGVDNLLIDITAALVVCSEL